MFRYENVMSKTTINDVVEYLDKTFHLEYQEDYDNAGFLLGEGAAEYRGSLVALDLTPAVIDEAMALGLNLIVTHHPFIFTGVKQLTDRTETGRMVRALILHGIAVYAAHTNLDNLPWGVNGILSEKLKLENCKILRECTGGQNISIGAGMVGELPRSIEADLFLQKVKSITGQPTIRASKHDSKRKVKRVALCGGSGNFLIDDAIAAKADVFLTADLKYHDFQRGEGRIIIADGGHYETEQFVKEIIYRAILEKFRTFACRISEKQEGLVQYI